MSKRRVDTENYQWPTNPLRYLRDEPNAKVYAVWKQIDQIISKEHIDQLTQKTLATISNTLNSLRLTESEIAVGWSGGKDSSVVTSLMQKLGIKKFGHCTSHIDLEYPALNTFYEQNRPSGCKVIRYTPGGLDWLAENKEYLFRKDNVEWFKLQWKAQYQFAQENNIKLVVMGRRRLDNNLVSKTGLTKNKHFIAYSPIKDWYHEEVLGYVFYNNIELPPCYEWVRGFNTGPDPWPKYRTPNLPEKENWKILHQIDKGIVEKASKYFPLAQIIAFP